jgi:hypothetical protein
MPLSDTQLIENLRNLEYIQEKWLHCFSDDCKDEGVHPVPRQMVEKLKKLVQAGQSAEAWKIYDKLNEMALAHGTLEDIGDAEVISAWAQTQIGRNEEAYRLLLDANNRYIPDGHNYAVTLWMLGIILWHSDKDQKWEAIRYWEDCRSSFEGLRSNNRLEQSRSAWYKNRGEEIERFLKITQEDSSWQDSISGPGPQPKQPGDQPGIPPDGAPPESTNKSIEEPDETTSSQPEGPPIPPPPSRPKGQASSEPEGWLKLYPILPGAVSAGEYKNVLEANSPEEFLLAGELEINDLTYRIVSLRGSRVVPRMGSKSTYVIQVSGKSMDAYPILPGDYVIVNTAIQPQNSDVVVTRMIKDPGDDAKGNIKYLESIRGDEIVLSCRSHQPEFKDENGQDKKFYIHKKHREIPEILGVAVIRLTPKNQVDSESGDDDQSI